MTVLVDTSVWSLALRRRSGTSAARVHVTEELARLVDEGRAALIGPIRQELLSGVRDATQFVLLRERLRAFDDIAIGLADYEDAAELSNRCRAKGVQGSSVDFLICAVALRRHLPIFTTDRDFTHFTAAIPILLHTPRP